MAQQKKSGTFKAIIIFGLVIVALGLVYLLTAVIYPEAIQNFARAHANETLVEQNNQLSGQLNQTQIGLANVTDQRDRAEFALREEQAKRFLWPVLIAIVLLGLLLVYLWQKSRKKQGGLSMPQAKKLFLPQIRKTYGFPESQDQSYPKITGFASERVGSNKNEKDEAYFFIEYEFFPKNGPGYIKGIRSNPRNTVSIALLNFRYEVYQREMPGVTLAKAIEYAHRIELWGFHLQKSAREDDINKLIQDANSIKEIKKAVEDDAEVAG